ncbi:XRE family transcriptional regulator [Pseudomonas japonica]|uniref:XRE family transcriptional regulator n=1 Tax=Pseudomonas japonica TaxID=256466 RepID=UPI0015E3A479|nr:XRE family transcriptional regulator [Pseudomonas japonica]MBA1245263.1 XRE family transcriptional regulator [Pseudomonas japonica]
MKRIRNYVPPSAPELAELKNKFGRTSQQMADIYGISQGANWRRYTGGADPRPMSIQMHFHMAALLTLAEPELTRVLATMSEHGARLEDSPPELK